MSKPVPDTDKSTDYTDITNGIDRDALVTVARLQTFSDIPKTQDIVDQLQSEKYEGKHRVSITRALDRLEEENCLRKFDCEDNPHAVRYELTPTGKEVIDALRMQYKSLPAFGRD